MDKAILVTGDQGYIGTELKYYLDTKSIPYFCFDKINGLRVENICYGLDDIDFPLFSCIVHLAAISGIKACEDVRREATITNVVGSFALFGLSRILSIPVVFASSQAAKLPTNFYGITKYMAEVHAMELNKTGADIRILRFSNVYGGHDYINRKNTVISRFIKEDPITVNGDGTQRRNFIHVKDVCRAIYKATKCEKFNYPMDIGSKDSININELANMCSSKGNKWTKHIVWDKDSKFVGVNKTNVHTAEAKKWLDFEVKEVLEEYISDIIHIQNSL